MALMTNDERLPTRVRRSSFVVRRRRTSMTERSYQDAVQVLRDRIGGRWEGVEGEGRDEMVRVLKQELSYDNDEANSAIDAMLRTGQLQYHHYDDAADQIGRSEPPPASPVLGGPQTTNTNMPGAPVRS